MPTFEIPTLEIDTTPKQSAYIYEEIPEFQKRKIIVKPKKVVDIAPEEVIDLDAIDAPFEAAPTDYEEELM